MSMEDRQLPRERMAGLTMMLKVRKCIYWHVCLQSTQSMSCVVTHIDPNGNTTYVS